MTYDPTKKADDYWDRKRAKQFVERILLKLDRGGDHYRPDFRDTLADEQEWLEDELAKFLGEDEL